MLCRDDLLCGRQVGNCRVWYCTRTSIDMGRCKVCVLTETNAVLALVRSCKVLCTRGITWVVVWWIQEYRDRDITPLQVHFKPPTNAVKTYPILLFFFIRWTSTLKRLVIPYKQFLVPGSYYYASMTLLPVSWDFGFFGALTVMLCCEKWKEEGRLHHIDCGVVNMGSTSSSCRLWFGLILRSFVPRFQLSALFMGFPFGIVDGKIL